MGLSVLPRGTPHLHKIHSAESQLETVWDRYAIRAGRNLPDKEFRYLRTVIVTAAVYRGFNSELAPLLFNLPAPGRRQTLYVISSFAEPCVLLNSCHPGSVPNRF